MKLYFKAAVVALFMALLNVDGSRAQAQVFIDWDDNEQLAQLEQTADSITPVYVDDLLIPSYYYSVPLIFTDMALPSDTLSLLQKKPSNSIATEWVDKEVYKLDNLRRLRRDIFVKYPESVKYNINTLPEPPKQYIAVADPEKAILVIEELHTELDPNAHEVVAEKKEFHWLNSFNGAVQLSQAYLSPNWYQGGNSHLNLLVNAAYGLKLNTNYHPNLLFELNISYKLAVNSTPDDTLRKYNISEDLFQINSKFGLRASKRWFYTLTLMAKTQFFNNYASNTNKMKASFLSPGEVNVGLGMTYSYTNPKKTLDISASISPASWNLRTCINRKMDPTVYDIKPGRKVVNQIGSSGEMNLTWKIAYNITYKTRLFLFTDYDYLQGDWENTFSFNINKYLSTQLFIHLRYDSSTPRLPDSKWHRWQLREILSFGFAYTFATV